MAIMPGRITRNGKQHLRHRGDERRAPRRVHRVGGHGALHDEEVRAPVAERQHEAQPHDQAEPLDAHRIAGRAAHVLPRLGHRARVEPARHRLDRQPRRQAVPAADVDEPDARPAARSRRRSGRTAAPRCRSRTSGRRGRCRRARWPPRAAPRRVKSQPEQQLQELAHRVHRDAGGEDRHRRERDRVEAARLLVEPQLQVLGHRAGARLP